MQNIPHFFTTIELPSVIKWAFDKVTYRKHEDLEVEGRKATSESWMFEGKFTRRPKAFWQQFNCPETGEQFIALTHSIGGEYRGQKPTVVISLCRYASVDGLPLPV